MNLDKICKDFHNWHHIPNVYNFCLLSVLIIAKCQDEKIKWKFLRWPCLTEEEDRSSSPFLGINVFKRRIAWKWKWKWLSAKWLMALCIIIIVEIDLVIPDPSVHLSIRVSALLRQLVPRLWLRQQLWHGALAQTQNIPDGDDRQHHHQHCHHY